jgi:hypothetical protein
VLFFPKAAISTIPKAGLLTRFTFCGLPIILLTVAWRIQKAFLKKLTASGNVPDLHRVPFSSAPYSAETFAAAKVEIRNGKLKKHFSTGYAHSTGY